MDDRKRTNNTINPRINDGDDDDTATANRSNRNINLMHQQLLRAIARGDLQSARRIVESISSSEDDDERRRRTLINHAEIWTETPPSSSSAVGGKNDHNRAVRPREATTTRTTTESGGIQLGELGYTFRKRFAAGWFAGTVVRMILPLARHASIATNKNDTTTKKEEEDGGLEGGGGVKKHDDYYRRCVYTDGDSEDLTVDDIIQLVKADPNNNKSSSNDSSNDTTTNVVKEEKEKDEGTSNNNDNNGLVMSSNNNNSNTSSTSSTVVQQLEWYDITPLTLAVMRGHDDIVEYLLRLGADPTLMGYPKNQLQHPDNNNKAHNNIMDAYIAASRLCKMIRRCRRTQDLLLSVKPFWKKASYYGSSVTSASAAVTSTTTTSSSNNKLRTEYTNVPMHTTWMLNAIDQVPKIVDYPLLCLNYNESMFDIIYWKTKMCDYTKVIKDNKLSSISTTTMNNDNWVEVGQSRRCSSCREYKPVQSYYKNEKKKGILARCISCVANNPETLDLLQLHDNNNNSSSILPPISTSHATPVTSSSVVEVLPIAGAADGNSKINITQSTTTVEGIVKLELDNYSNLLQNNNVKRRKLD